MKNLNVLDWIAIILLAVGGINWGLVGALEFDLVAYIFGPMSLLARIVYGVVGLCAIYTLLMLPKCAKK
jgi:hypothetical protein